MTSKRSLLMTGLAVAVTGAGAATGAAAASGAPQRAAKSSSKAPVLKLATVSVQENGKTSKRSVLVTGSGRAVYLLTGDSSKHPECDSSSCLSDWPAVTSNSKPPAVGKGVTGKVAIWSHKGLNQVTINGHPLYTYAGDPGAGQADGEGIKSFGGTWWVVSGKGAEVSLSSTSSPGGGGSGGGYTY